MTLKEIQHNLQDRFDNKLYLNKKEASKALGISVSTLQNYLAHDLVENVTMGNRKMFSIAVLAKCIRDGIDATGITK